MTPFAGDLLEPHRTDADLVVQVEADSAAAAERALQDLVAGVRVSGRYGGPPGTAPTTASTRVDR
jgi:hypothetical protein